jgi:hypothetical protein
MRNNNPGELKRVALGCTSLKGVHSTKAVFVYQEVCNLNFF